MRKTDEIVLSEDGKKSRREYYKEWRRKNPDKVKAHQARYWERKAQAAKEKGGSEGER